MSKYNQVKKQFDKMYSDLNAPIAAYVFNKELNRLDPNRFIQIVQLETGLKLTTICRTRRKLEEARRWKS